MSQTPTKSAFRLSTTEFAFIKMSAHCHCDDYEQEPRDRTVGTAHTGAEIRERTCDNCHGLIKVLH